MLLVKYKNNFSISSNLANADNTHLVSKNIDTLASDISLTLYYSFMPKLKSIPLLLAPVRDETSLMTAITAGADAVFFGVGFLNMRASSKGITLKQLDKAVRYAHKHKVKVYVTVNAVAYDSEIKALRKMLRTIKTAKVDAVIGWDLAVLQEAKKIKLPIHISTQASISNTEAALFYKKLGARCIVLARECTLEQIKVIKKKAKIPVEIFVHGAMCVSVSGRCFMSQELYGKSANRGECVQPCRREYTIIDKQTKKELIVGCGYVLSPKDMCTLPILDKIVATKVDILKIEGRARSADYVKTVIKAYRKALDAIATNTYTPALKTELMTEVSKVYNRGFSTGFFLGKPGAEAWTNSSGNNATHKREYVGIIAHYYPKSKIAQMKVVVAVQAGNVLQIQGPRTGVIDVTLYSFRANDLPANSAEKQSEITFVTDTPVRKGDVVYKTVIA